MPWEVSVRSRQPQTSKQGQLNPNVEEAEGNGWGSGGDGVDFLQKTWDLAGYPPGLKAVQSYFRHYPGQPDSPHLGQLRSGNFQDAAETRMLLKWPQTIPAKAASGKHGELAKVLPQETVCPFRRVQHPNYRRPPPLPPEPAPAEPPLRTAAQLPGKRRPRALGAGQTSLPRGNGGIRGAGMGGGGGANAGNHSSRSWPEGPGKLFCTSCCFCPGTRARGWGSAAPAPARILTHLGAVGSVLRHFPP